MVSVTKRSFTFSLVYVVHVLRRTDNKPVRNDLECKLARQNSLLRQRTRLDWQIRSKSRVTARNVGWTRQGCELSEGNSGCRSFERVSHTPKHNTVSAPHTREQRLHSAQGHKSCGKQYSKTAAGQKRRNHAEVRSTN